MLKASQFVLDGEIVALDSTGRPSFQALLHRRTGSLAIVYYAFDVLVIDQESLLDRPLEERRRRLIGLEGVVAKRRDSTYRPGH